MAGAVTDLLGVPASQVALGRSHTCILTQMGVIYTFGSNQFGQCGVNYVPPVHAFEGMWCLRIFMVSVNWSTVLVGPLECCHVKGGGGGRTSC